LQPVNKQPESSKFRRIHVGYKADLFIGAHVMIARANHKHNIINMYNFVFRDQIQWQILLPLPSKTIRASARLLMQFSHPTVKYNSRI